MILDAQMESGLAATICYCPCTIVMAVLPPPKPNPFFGIKGCGTEESERGLIFIADSAGQLA